MIFTIIQNIFSLSTFIVLHMIIPALYGMLITTFVANVGSLLWLYMRYCMLSLYAERDFSADLRRGLVWRHIKEKQARLTNWRLFLIAISDPINDIMQWVVNMAKDSAHIIERRLETHDNVEHFCSFVILTCLLINVKSLVFFLDSFHAIVKESLEKFKQRHTLLLLEPSIAQELPTRFAYSTQFTRTRARSQEQNLDLQEDVREPEHIQAEENSVPLEIINPKIHRDWYSQLLARIKEICALKRNSPIQSQRPRRQVSRMREEQKHWDDK